MKPTTQKTFTPKNERDIAQLAFIRLAAPFGAQKDAAKALKVPQPVLSCWVTGARSPNAVSLLRFMKGHKTFLNDLLTLKTGKKYSI